MSDKGSATTVAPTVYVGKIRRIGEKDATPTPTVPTTGQIWPRGNRVQQ